MSFFDRTKEFFGLQPVDVDSMEQEDAYYAEERTPVSTERRSAYESEGAVAYSPRTYERPEPARSFEPTIVPVSLSSYKEAMKIGQPFLDGDAVVFELTDADKTNARRLIDFSAGLVLAGKGEMKNLTSKMDTDRKVFAILPEDSSISRAELERAARLR
ncbi:cell division protein SepF [Corynebacterium phocae]|uniref:Cell division protein SepF n=1 Tax=Corynebacterium phocae TaxID=161895 RepID=A0A1L7D263_9CORY|nr:cell division protein SepF [Corynebacterium phocae]APT92235.1 cell division protein SepF [Corynebacterium phocae]KAA8725376.1 DUF552 domain-containing protein [Corynebacterium phocae]